MDTAIDTGNFRVATFSGTDSNGVAITKFDAPVAVVIDNEAIASYTPNDDTSGNLTGLSAGTANFTATATWKGFTSTVTGVITVAAAVTGFVLSVVLGDQQTTAPAA